MLSQSAGMTWDWTNQRCAEQATMLCDERLRSVRLSARCHRRRLDINLEKGNTREELRKMAETAHEQDQRFERELNNVRTMLEASKNDMIKWFVGMMVSVLLVSASVMRMLGKW